MTSSPPPTAAGLPKTCSRASPAATTTAPGARAWYEGGSFVAPTVFADVSPDMRIAREEIFGPVITIIPARDVDDAVAISNSTNFGLGGIVFGSDEDAAFQVARRVDTGSIGVNFFASNHYAPFGGRHDSGLGVEYGIEGLNAYLTPQSVHRRSR